MDEAIEISATRFDEMVAWSARRTRSTGIIFICWVARVGGAFSSSDDELRSTRTHEENQHKDNGQALENATSSTQPTRHRATLYSNLQHPCYIHSATCATAHCPPPLPSHCWLSCPSPHPPSPRRSWPAAAPPLPRGSRAARPLLHQSCRPRRQLCECGPYPCAETACGASWGRSMTAWNASSGGDAGSDEKETGSGGRGGGADGEEVSGTNLSRCRRRTMSRTKRRRRKTTRTRTRRRTRRRWSGGGGDACRGAGVLLCAPFPACAGGWDGAPQRAGRKRTGRTSAKKSQPALAGAEQAASRGERGVQSDGARA